jgi:hypothetical protein
MNYHITPNLIIPPKISRTIEENKYFTLKGFSGVKLSFISETESLNEFSSQQLRSFAVHKIYKTRKNIQGLQQLL